MPLPDVYGSVRFETLGAGACAACRFVVPLGSMLVYILYSVHT